MESMSELSHSPRVLVHIGMHKTASSWLQEHLFGRPDTGFWSAASPELPAKLRAKYGSGAFYRGQDGGFVRDEDFDPSRVRGHLALETMPAGSCCIVSNERLSGHPLSGGVDRTVICQRLKAVVPQARILLVIREQRSMILSNYMQCLKFGGAAGIEAYLVGKNDGRVPTLSPVFWQYDKLIALYTAAFGAENLLVLPYEVLASEPSLFIGRICEFVQVKPPANLPFGTKSNARPDYFAYDCLRFASPWLRSSRGNGFAPSLLGRKKGKAVHTKLQRWTASVTPTAWNDRAKGTLLDRIEKRTAGFYGESNRVTSAMTGIDLASYGYEIDR